MMRRVLFLGVAKWEMLRHDTWMVHEPSGSLGLSWIVLVVLSGWSSIFVHQKFVSESLSALQFVCFPLFQGNPQDRPISLRIPRCAKGEADSHGVPSRVHERVGRAAGTLAK